MIRASISIGSAVVSAFTGSHVLHWVTGAPKEQAYRRVLVACFSLGTGSDAAVSVFAGRAGGSSVPRMV